jgi:hypothetical protein
LYFEGVKRLNGGISGSSLIDDVGGGVVIFVPKLFSSGDRQECEFNYGREIETDDLMNILDTADNMFSLLIFPGYF